MPTMKSTATSFQRKHFLGHKHQTSHYEWHIGLINIQNKNISMAKLGFIKKYQFISWVLFSTFNPRNIANVSQFKTVHKMLPYNQFPT